MTDRPNQLDDLWVDWENKTLKQKQAALKTAVGRMSKILFSDEDHSNLIDKALEVGKALHQLDPDRNTFVTPTRKWLEANNPNYARARRAHIRQKKFGEPFPPDLDPWAPMSPQNRERLQIIYKLKKNN